MNNPVDRLGQPLSVGDWVVFEDCISPNPKDGSRYQIDAFITHPLSGRAGCLFTSGMRVYLESTTKINPKQEHGTWESLKDIWVPEGVKA